MILQMRKMKTDLNILKVTSSLEVVSSYVEDDKELNVLVSTKVSPDDKIKEKV